MNKSKVLILRGSDGAGDRQQILSAESETGYTFPALYKKILLEHKNINVVTGDFDFYKPDYDEKAEWHISFLKLDGDEALVYQYHVVKNWWEHDHLVPFGVTGGGDKICFDYRLDPSSSNPPVVTIVHDDWNDDDTQKVYHVANTFREFVNILYNPDEEELEWLRESRKKRDLPLPFEWVVPDDDHWE